MELAPSFNGRTAGFEPANRSSTLRGASNGDISVNGVARRIVAPQVRVRVPHVPYTI